jgi:hypothetical protein
MRSMIPDRPVEVNHANKSTKLLEGFRSCQCKDWFNAFGRFEICRSHSVPKKAAFLGTRAHLHLRGMVEKPL